MVAEARTRIKVAIVEDEIDICLSLVELLQPVTGIDVVATFCSGEEAVAEIGDVVPDVVLMDLRLPGINGVECVRRIKADHPQVHLMMYTAFEDDDALFDSLRAGANGYVLKRATPAVVVEAIRDLAAGGSPMSPGIARKLVRHFQPVAAPPAAATPATTALSAREQQVLALLARGLRYKEIAEQLDVSVTTVRTHLGRMYEKLHVTSRTEAVVKFLTKA